MGKWTLGMRRIHAGKWRAQWSGGPLVQYSTTDSAGLELAELLDSINKEGEEGFRGFISKPPQTELLDSGTE